MQEYQKAIEDITELFDKKQVKDLDTSIEMVKLQYELLVELFNTSDDEETKQWATKYTVSTLLKIIQKMLSSPKVEENKIGSVYTIYRKAYAFAGRRSLAHFIDFMEWDRPTDNKVYMNRKQVLNPIIYNLNKMIFDKNMNYLVFSLPPSYGKTFVLNYFTAWLYGIDINNSVLRMSYNDELLVGFSRSIKDLIASDNYAEVFPMFTLYRNKPFESQKDSDWKLKNADVVVSHYIRTRDGGTTGVRARIAIIFDDMTKGRDEANNDGLHQNYWEKYTTEWLNRRENERVKYIFAGTMWTPKDLLNRITENESSDTKVFPSKKFNYVWETEDGHAAFIRVPLLDENDNSTCTHVMSTKEALKMREITDPFLWSCVYQQKPIAPSGLEFAYENLQTYDELPDDLLNYAYAVLDPTRKGKDNISMPITRLSKDGEKHYVIDWFYKKVAMTEAYDDIIDKIKEHKIVQFEIENNTDTSLKTVFELKLKEKGINYCTITEKFNTVKKEIRIKDARGMIVRQMLFKKKGNYLPNSDYGRAMEAFTTYSFDYPNKNDDAPDSLALYVNRFMFTNDKINSITPINRALLGF